jgi:hypothetical protein
MVPAVDQQHGIINYETKMIQYHPYKNMPKSPDFEGNNF